MDNEFDRTDESDQLGYCPGEFHWNGRRDQFRVFEGGALGPHNWSSHEQVEPLIRELEHMYCAGAWLGTIVMAQAVVEVSLATFDKGGLKANQFLEKYGLHKQAQWLRDRRNNLVHRHHNQPAVVSLEQQLWFREALRQDAKMAVASALRISFLPSRHPEVSLGMETQV